MTSASDDKACVSKFNQVETDIQVYINANMMHLQDHAYDAGYEAGQAAALRSPAPAATVTGWRPEWGILDKGDVIQDDDEFLNWYTQEWQRAIALIGKHVDTGIVRRRLTPPAQGDAMQLQRAAEALAIVCQKLISYRDRNGALNFQLEKADDFINMMRPYVDQFAAVRGADGEGV